MIREMLKLDNTWNWISNPWTANEQVQHLKFRYSGRGSEYYLLNKITTEYILYWIPHSLLLGCIYKSREIMISNKILCSFSHNSRIQFMSTMVSIVTLKWIHECVIIYSVMVHLPLGWKSSMKLRHSRANFPNTDILWKSTIESCMNSFYSVVVEWRDKVCNLKAEMIVSLCNVGAYPCRSMKRARNLVRPDPKHAHPYLSYLHQPNEDRSFPAALLPLELSPHSAEW